MSGAASSAGASLAPSCGCRWWSWRRGAASWNRAVLTHALAQGPAPTNVPADKPDIIDEALRYFKANVLFRNFELNGAADKTLAYLTLFISEALQKIGNCDLESAKKEMYSLSIADFWVPGHESWPLAGFTAKPASRAEQDQVRAWMAQMRQECGVRLCELVFARDPKKADKWWMVSRSARACAQASDTNRVRVAVLQEQEVHEQDALR